VNASTLESAPVSNFWFVAREQVWTPPTSVPENASSRSEFMIAGPMLDQ